jgi:hypothetical protein
MLDRIQILLQTKLHRPRLPKDLLIRSRLVELLNHDIDRQLILVCAPAGFGKTTLVSTWLERMAADQPAAAASFPTAWLSLDETDSDLDLFLRYFIAALRTIFKEACEGTLAIAYGLNLLMLLFVALLPFMTRLMVTRISAPDVSIAAFIYGLNFLVASLALSLLMF